MGSAEDWQTEIAYGLKFAPGTILNPHRTDWDSSWEQNIDNEQFNQQVTWELNALDAADVIIFHFDPATKSPITLLELGLYAKSSKLIVHCPKGFWRKGNVDIVCQRFSVKQVNSWEELLQITYERLYKIKLLNPLSYSVK